MVLSSFCLFVAFSAFEKIKTRFFLAGKKKVTLKKLVPMSAEWARLEDSSSSTVEEFIDGVNGGCTSDYLFDWSLPLHCPDLAATVTIPEYFAGEVVSCFKKRFV